MPPTPAPTKPVRPDQTQRPAGACSRRFLPSLPSAPVAALLLLASSSFTASRASAADPTAERRALRDPFSDVSSQHAAFELRFGPYRPNVDQNTNANVFADFFGDDQRLMLGVELDWQILRAPYVGTLGVGVGWGYTQMSAPNAIPAELAALDPPPVAQESSLNVMPTYAVGVLRVDTLARNFRIPLVPYGKLGLAYSFWWVNDGIGTATNDAGVKGKDTSLGTQAALGLMFLLDILEPSAARALDAEGGVNNSYLFFEWSMSDFGGEQMNVGDNTWVTGLAIEM